MQTILIPTDFRVQSFDCARSLCEQFSGRDIKIIFTHLFKLSDSITDLLMLSRRIKEYESVSAEFYQEGERIRQRFSQLKEINIEFFYGGTLAAFKNFLERFEVDFILDPASCCYSPLNKSSVDPAVLVTRAGVPVLKPIKTQKDDRIIEKEELEEV